MLDIGKEEAAKAKCYFTHTALPQYIDEKQPPTKRKPFSSIAAQPYSHSLEMIVPQSNALRIQSAIKDTAGSLTYAKVNLKLSDVLKGDFFNEYIKSGNILLLSEGQAGIENTFRLHEGVLHIELDRATYERAGLVGQPIQGPGRKHQKSRFAIDFNLRLPGMVAGKPGFERLRRAAENTLDSTLTWLFYDLRTGACDGPITAFQPTVRVLEPSIHTMEQINVPSFPSSMEDEVDATELLEWIALTCLDSPRIHHDDQVDSLLCRYSIPGDDPLTMDLVRLRWHGFLPSSYVSKVLTAATKSSAEQWFAMQVSGFDGKACTVLKTSDGHAMTWDCE